MKTVAAALLLLAAIDAHADALLEATYQAFALIDMAQTLDLREHPGLHETNPILGRHPSDAKVYGYFAICGVGHALITRALGSSPLAAQWESVTIDFEAKVIGSNKKLGLTVRF